MRPMGEKVRMSAVNRPVADCLVKTVVQIFTFLVGSLGPIGRIRYIEI